MPAPTGTTWRGFGARFLIALVVTFGFTASSIGAAYWYASNKFDEAPVVDIPEGVLDVESDDARAANYLIVGSDTREFVETEEQVQAFGDPDEQGGQRSDTILVLHVDPVAEDAMVLSFPRDLWVEIPGRGESRINAAFNDGPQGVIQTIQQNFDIPIHHYLEVDFAGFEGIVNAMGSVDIYFPTPARDDFTGLDVREPGCKSLGGAQALAYVRSRHYEYYDADDDTWREDPRSDFGRIARQQYFLRTLAQAAIEKGARNLFTAKALLDETVPNLERDESLDFTDVLALIRAFNDAEPSRIPMETVPATGGTVGGAQVLFLDEEGAAPLFERMRSFAERDGDGPVAPPARPDLDPGDVTVRVLNGSGVDGIAGDTLAELEALDFASAGATNADRIDYEQTEIRYPEGGEEEALFLLYYLGGVGELVEVDSVAGADVELVVGGDFAGISDPSSAPETTTTTAPTTTTTTTTVPFAPGDPEDFGLPDPSSSADGLPLVGCPPGT